MGRRRSKLLLTGVIRRTGVVIPTMPDVYGPVLAELRQHGIAFTHEAVRRD